MCISKIFKRKQVLELPHPEEPFQNNQTMDNVCVPSIIELWMSAYKVSVIHWWFWRSKIVVELSVNLGVPAASWEENGVRHIKVELGWLNPGVIAHEQAHNSYSLLDSKLQTKWYNWVENSKKTPLIKLMEKEHPYALSNSIEYHAELYRYLGEQIPEELKKYYLRLF